MPYENLNDSSFFRHYYFVRNSFVKMSNKVFLKVEPRAMVSNLKENLLQTFQRSVRDLGSMEDAESQEQFRGLFNGKIIKARYTSWNQYYKIVDVCFDKKLNSHAIEFNGNRYSFLRTFMSKYPFLKNEVTDETQLVIKAMPLKSRFDKRKYDSQYHKITAETNNEDYVMKDFTNYFVCDSNSQDTTEWVIPELFHLLEDIYLAPSQYRFKERPPIFYDVNKHSLVYYVAAKFVDNFIISETVHKFLMNWRIIVNKSPESLYLQLFDKRVFQNDMKMFSPKAAESVERDLNLRYRFYIFKSK